MALVIQDNLQQDDIQNRLYASMTAAASFAEKVRKQIALGYPCQKEIDRLMLLVAMIESTRCYTSLDETFPFGEAGGADNTAGTYNAYTETEIEAVYSVIEQWTGIGFPHAGTIWEDKRKKTNKVYVIPGLIDEDNQDFIKDENGQIIYAEIYPLTTEDDFIKYINDLGGNAATTLSNWQDDSSTDAPYIIITDRTLAYRGKND
jgi:hypothetical protein